MSKALDAYLLAFEKGKRLPEQENIIAEDARCSFWYAKNILKSRFVLAEKTIFESELKDEYLKFLENTKCVVAIRIINGNNVILRISNKLGKFTNITMGNNLSNQEILERTEKYLDFHYPKWKNNRVYL